MSKLGIKVHGNKSKAKQETELSKLVEAYVCIVSGEGNVPASVEVISTTPIDDDGSVFIEFKGDGSNNFTDGITYALGYGVLSRMQGFYVYSDF